MDNENKNKKSTSDLFESKVSVVAGMVVGSAATISGSELIDTFFPKEKVIINDPVGPKDSNKDSEIEEDIVIEKDNVQSTDINTKTSEPEPIASWSPETDDEVIIEGESIDLIADNSSVDMQGESLVEPVLINRDDSDLLITEDIETEPTAIDDLINSDLISNDFSSEPICSIDIDSQFSDNIAGSIQNELFT